MLIVIAGPSGSGKSTFIKLIIEYIPNSKVIDVDVCPNISRIYEQNVGRVQVDEVHFNRKLHNAEYAIINKYNNTRYGYSIPNDHDDNKSIYILDYPGEYPECPELEHYNWKGILILPPSEIVLIQRLIQCSREGRILSAVKEYKECLEDISNEKMINWFIIYNEYYGDLYDGLKVIENNVSAIY